MITFHPLVHLLPHSVPQTSQATLPPVAGDCFPTVPPNSSLSTNKHHYHLFLFSGFPSCLSLTFQPHPPDCRATVAASPGKISTPASHYLIDPPSPPLRILRQSSVVSLER